MHTALFARVESKAFCIISSHLLTVFNLLKLHRSVALFCLLNTFPVVAPLNLLTVCLHSSHDIAPPFSLLKHTRILSKPLVEELTCLYTPSFLSLDGSRAAFLYIYIFLLLKEGVIQTPCHELFILVLEFIVTVSFLHLSLLINRETIWGSYVISYPVSSSICPSLSRTPML